MARSKRQEQRRRPASAAPQRVHHPLQDFVDLTQTDPLVERSHALPARSAALSPVFSGRASTVAVPQNPTTNPAYLFQQLALAKHRSSMRPSFSSKRETEAVDGPLEEDGREETPSPIQTEVKEKRKKKNKVKKEKQQLEEAKANNKPDKNKEHNKLEDGQVKKKSRKVNERPADDVQKPVVGKKRAKEANHDHEPTDQIQDPGPAMQSRKRMRHNNNNQEIKEVKEVSSQRAHEAETDATNKLRESLPTARIARVTRDLQQETGVVPTEMAILVTAARETIIDLATQQLEQTQRSYHAVQTELVAMLKKQKERLERLEAGRAKDSSDEDGDDTISRAHPDEACQTS